MALRFELFPDEIEVVFYQAQPVFRQMGVEKFTPLGVFYLLASNPNTAKKLGAVTGKDAKTLAREAEQEIRSRYQGAGSFTATKDTAALLNEALEEAGQPNTANVGHLLLAMFTMPNAKQTDAYQFLTARGINQKVVEKAMREGKGVLPTEIEQLTTDHIAEILTLAEPFHESQNLSAVASNVAACLRKKHGNKALIFGNPGAGRHTLVRRIALGLSRNEYRGFEGYQLRRINFQTLSQSSQAKSAVQALAKNLPEKVILLIDDLRFTDLALWQPLLLHKNPLIAVTNSAEAKNLGRETVGVMEQFEVKEPSRKEVEAILGRHLPDLVRHHGLNHQKVDDRAMEALVNHGPLITGLALPGAAIQLLDFVCGQDALTGDRVLTLEDVANEVSQRTGIPVASLTQTETDRLRRLPQILAQRIIGQDEAKGILQSTLKRSRLGLRDPKRPILVAAFLGPTGVGKTEMTKALAEFLFDYEDAIIRIDMSEYREGHTVSRLIGAPPGYVGYDAGGQLTQAIRQRPFSIILFDEIDKAHPAVYDVLLQLMDEGRLTDGQGYTVDARHTIILFTSNHGSPLIYAGLAAKQSLDQIERESLSWFRQAVRPEFLNRLDKIIFFHPLSKEHSRQILDLLLDKYVVKPVFAQHKIQVEVSDSAKEVLLNEGYDETLGARPLRRAIENLLLDPLGDEIFEGRLKVKDKVICEKDPQRNRLVFRKK